MASDEVIDRLMQVEKEADAVVADAQRTADEEARAVESRERERFLAAVATRQRELSEMVESTRTETEIRRNTEMAAYRDRLAARPVNRAALFDRARSILAGDQ